MRSGHCSISFHAPDDFSDAIKRMATKGKSSMIAR